jgi:pentatricopeptide repeat protein
MRAQGRPPDIVIYNILILEYGRRGHLSQAMKYFGELKEEGLVPDGGTYCAALGACRKAGDVERGGELIKEMKGAGMQLDQVAYSILIDMFGKAGRCEDAAATFRELRVR